MGGADEFAGAALGSTEGMAGVATGRFATGGGAGDGTGGTPGSNHIPPTTTSKLNPALIRAVMLFYPRAKIWLPSLSNQTVYPALVGVDMERALGALRDFTRRDILLRFYADHKPRSVEDVSREVGIHRSVAFDHLERLVALGYLEVGHRRGLPGKPAKIYKLVGGPVQISHPMRRYDLVAESLANAFDDLGDIGSHAVRRAGRLYGQSIAVPDARSRMAAVEPILEMGAEYDFGKGDIIQCTNCLFAEVCRRAPVICRFHAGVLEGLLQDVEPHSSIKVLGFRDPYGCAYMVEEQAQENPLQAQAQ